MLSQSLKTTIQNSYNELEKVGFVKRKSQMLLLGKLATAAAQGIPFVGEAPTGTGKSLAYSLALIPLAQSKEEPLVLSTATIALQNQLCEDLAFLQKNTSLKFTYAQAKGRNNFFCQASADSSFESGQISSSHEESKLRDICNQFQGKWSGDFETIKGNIDFKTQALATSSPEACNRKTCPYSSDCPYYKNIDAVRKADVVIANHALIAVMAEIGFGTYLKGDDSDCMPVLAIDESHHMHSIFRDAMSVKLNFEETNKKLKSNSRFDKELSTYSDISPSAMNAQNIADDMNTGLRALSNEVAQFVGEEKQRRFKQSELSQHFMYQIEELKNLNKSFNKNIEAIRKFVENKKDELPEKIMNSLTIKVNIVTNIIDSIESISKWININEPKASWFESKGSTYSISICPLEVSKLFNEKVIDACHSVSMVSATLRTNGNFEHVIQRLGLPDTTEQLLVPSPFDPSNANLHTPNTGFLPNDPKHILAVAKEAPKLFKNGEGSMVLFSSKTKLKSFAETLTPSLKKACLVQGELSRTEIINRHKKAVDSGQTSVILGLQSFGEGVDLKGHYLTTIIVTQIPFMHINDPISAAENEHIQASGGNAFMTLSLPEATIKIVQWCGRLIRTESDKGDIYLFDNRITSKGYGKGIISTLPAFNRM